MWDFLPSLANILNELFTGAIGGLVVATTALCGRVYKRKKIEKRFPVAGKYITFFEDLVDGERVTTPSISIVKQTGHKLKIITKMPNQRSWTLDGTIMQGGHISGVYMADAVYDDGLGSFYLKISQNSLEGMWNGYDHDNKMTNSGRYWFNRVLKADVVSYEEHYLNDILHTSSNAFGYGYISKKDIKNDETHFAIVCLIDGEFAGFCFGYLVAKGGIPDLVRTEYGILPDDIRVADEHGKLGVLKTIAVRRKYRGHGVGYALVSEAEKRLKKLKCECIVVPAWTISSKTALENILVQNDYTKWLEVAEYWQENCELGQFKCAAFNKKCQCSVTFFRKGRL